MAEDKKSFVLYADLIHTVRKMPKEKQGDLFMTILSYVNDENPAVDDLMVELVFEPIKLQMKRDLAKYETTKERRRELGRLAGLKSGESRKLVEPKAPKSNQNEPKRTNGSKNEPNEHVTVNDNGTVTVTDTVIPSTIVEGEKVFFSDDDDEINTNIKLAFLEAEKHQEEKITPKKENNISIAESLKYESPEWLDSVAMQQRHLPVIIIQKIDEFLIFLKTQEKMHTSRKEFVSHFINWISKKAQINQNKDPAKKENFIAGRQTEETLNSNFIKFKNYAK